LLDKAAALLGIISEPTAQIPNSIAAAVSIEQTMRFLHC
jgi:hypothetical protein